MFKSPLKRVADRLRLSSRRLTVALLVTAGLLVCAMGLVCMIVFMAGEPGSDWAELWEAMWTESEWDKAENERAQLVENAHEALAGTGLSPEITEISTAGTLSLFIVALSERGTLTWEQQGCDAQKETLQQMLAILDSIPEVQNETVASDGRSVSLPTTVILRSHDGQEIGRLTPYAGFHC